MQVYFVSSGYICFEMTFTVLEHFNPSGKLDVSVGPSNLKVTPQNAEEAPTVAVDVDWTLRDAEIALEGQTCWLTIAGRPTAVRMRLLLCAEWSSGTQRGEWILTSEKLRVF